ncbi:MAG TPA: Uma2 family endonuclease [Chloroflexota bacterium]|jgi:Uma2 family endonuclease
MATKILLTAEEFAECNPEDGKLYELVRGELVEMSNPTPRHGAVLAEAVYLLMGWAKPTKAGLVTCGDPGFILERAPDTVRGPDVAFVRKERAADAYAARPWPEFGPDFVIEVRSPSNSWREMQEKIAMFFAAGTLLALVLEPDKFAEVHRPGQEPVRLELNDTFSAEDVLPGFECKVAGFFPKL